MPIKLDFSPTCVVVYCTDCPHWRGFGFTKDEAHAVAVRHEENVHPASTQARNARDLYQWRHAGESENVTDHPESGPRGNPDSTQAH